MLEIFVAAYVGFGFFIISFTHSYYCSYFHDGKKELGLPFILKHRVKIEYWKGYIGAAILGILSSSLFLNYFNYLFLDFPNSVSGPAADWFAGLLIIGGFLIFIMSPILGGGAAMKWVLEGSLMLFTLLLILSIPDDATTFGQVQFIFSVSGAVLAGIYLFWLRHYIVESDKLDLSSVRGALDSFENRSEDTWAIWGTVVYFVFSGVYILIGYLFVFVFLNS